MNRFYRHYYTPTGRSKITSVDSITVGTGANAKIDGKWQTMSIRARMPDVMGDSLTIQMDRETAERVVKQLSAYLADVAPPPPPTLATRSA